MFLDKKKFQFFDLKTKFWNTFQQTQLRLFKYVKN